MPKWRKFLLSGHSGSAPIHFIDRERLIVVRWMLFIKLRVALKSIQWHSRRDFKSNCQEPMAIRLAIQWSTLKSFEQPIGGFKTGQCKIFIANCCLQNMAFVFPSSNGHKVHLLRRTLTRYGHKSFITWFQPIDKILFFRN